MAMAAVEFAEPASESQLEALAEKLRARNFEVVIVNDGAEAKAEVLKRIPEGAQVDSGSPRRPEDRDCSRGSRGKRRSASGAGDRAERDASIRRDRAREP